MTRLLLGVVSLCFLFGLLVGVSLTAWQLHGLQLELQELDTLCRPPEAPDPPRIPATGRDVAQVRR